MEIRSLGLPNFQAFIQEAAATLLKSLSGTPYKVAIFIKDYLNQSVFAEYQRIQSDINERAKYATSILDVEDVEDDSYQSVLNYRPIRTTPQESFYLRLDDEGNPEMRF